MKPGFSTGISHLAFIGKSVGDSGPIEDPVVRRRNRLG